jgi:hypothetical protein
MASRAPAYRIPEPLPEVRLTGAPRPWGPGGARGITLWNTVYARSSNHFNNVNFHDKIKPFLNEFLIRVSAWCEASDYVYDLSHSLQV